MAEGKLPSEVLAGRVREVREARRLTQAGLAERLRELAGDDPGSEWPKPMARATVAKVENRERGVLIEDLFALGCALNVSPTNLLVPQDEYTEQVAITPTVSVHAHWLRSWLYGQHQIPLDADFEAFMEHAPEREREELAAWRHGAIAALSTLHVFVRDALEGAANDNARRFPRAHAAGLRRESERVRLHVELLAEDLERYADELEQKQR